MWNELFCDIYNIYITDNFELCNCNLQTVCNLKKFFFSKNTVKPLITNTSEEFIKCRLDNFSMSFYTILCKFHYLRKYINSHEYAGTVLKSSI